MATEVITDSDNSLSKIISLLRDSNAAEELTLNEVSSHQYTLASPDAQNYIREVPNLLSQANDFLKSLINIMKDVLENATALVQNDREEKLEEAKPKKKPKDNASSGVSFGDASRLFTSQGFLGRLLSIGSLLIGTIVGAITPLVKIFKESRLGKLVTSILNSIKAKFNGILSAVKESKLVKFVIEIFNGIKGKFNSILAFVQNNPIGKILGKLFTSASDKFSSSIKRVLSGIKNFINPIMSFFKIGMKIGSVLSRFALPLVALIGTLVGAWRGYKEDGIIGALKGGIAGLLNSVVGGLLDLVKDGVSWLLGALGWESAEETLDSFSFTKLITDGVTVIIDGFISIFESIGEALTKGYESLKGMIGNGLNIAQDFIKSILQNVLPRPDPNGSWYDPVNLASKAIPKTVYDYAGINKDTGEITPIKPSQIGITPPSTSAAISTNPAISGGTTVINNVSRGGDVSNVSNSNVNNTNSAASPIITGSAMGMLYAF